MTSSPMTEPVGPARGESWTLPVPMSPTSSQALCASSTRSGDAGAGFQEDGRSHGLIERVTVLLGRAARADDLYNRALGGGNSLLGRLVEPDNRCQRRVGKLRPAPQQASLRGPRRSCVHLSKNNHHVSVSQDIHLKSSEFVSDFSMIWRDANGRRPIAW